MKWTAEEKDLQERGENTSQKLGEVFWKGQHTENKGKGGAKYPKKKVHGKAQ